MNIVVLGLEDQDYDLDIIRQVIEEVGVKEYKLFVNPILFMEAISDNVHVVILDDKMSGFGPQGLDVLIEVKRKNKLSFVIGYSATKDYELIYTYMNHGCDRWVDKNKYKPEIILSKYLKFGLQEAQKRLDMIKILKAQHKEYINDRR